MHIICGFSNIDIAGFQLEKMKSRDNTVDENYNHVVSSHSWSFSRQGEAEEIVHVCFGRQFLVKKPAESLQVIHR